jgi:hypothetical protein
MSAPRIPKKEEYWKKKGKKPLINSKGKLTYKNVMLMSHDDWDGVLSNLVIKKYLINQGFNIIGYGIVNYQEGWKYTTLNPDVINIAVDFSPFNDKLDIFVDHHGGELPKEAKDYAVKTNTGSAFEGICDQYNLQHDASSLYVIDMIDSAKYKHYGVDITTVLHFDWDIIKNSNNTCLENIPEKYNSYKKKLVFAGMVNQFIKRADHTTLIEVIHNCKEPSIYAVYLKLKEFYSGNNLWKKGNKRKDFLEDGKWRINTMMEKTRGSYPKKVYTNQYDFYRDYSVNGIISLTGEGYQIIGNLAFIPSGCWANAIRARAILEEDMRNGLLKENSIDFILLQYGSTLQMVAYDSITYLKEKGKLPILKNGIVMDNIGEYMSGLLDNFKKYLGYIDPSTYISTIEDDITVAGGHGGIGSISSISGSYNKNPHTKDYYIGMKYLDLFKNKIIHDISTCEWKNLKMVWTEDNDNTRVELEMDWRVMVIDEIRTDGKQKSKKELELINPFDK